MISHRRLLPPATAIRRAVKTINATGNMIMSAMIVVHFAKRKLIEDFLTYLGRLGMGSVTSTLKAGKTQIARESQKPSETPLGFL
jgi:hypothetical protein